ncbi:MAG TPA: hypothetical protein DIT35_00385, partial [Rhodospirillaceae bacterium]|nr:hypothetical protein [Rhodospirillaceae bacterium]
MPTTSQTVANGVRYNPAIAWLTLALLIVAACAGPKGKAVVIDRSYETYRHTAVKRGDYVIQRGDTVYGVAQRNGVSTRALIDRNKLLPPYYLVPGQTLGIPSIRIYTVRAGDSIYAISRRFDADMTTLVRLNGLPAPYTLQVGQRLKLPAGAELGTQVTTNSQGSNLPRDVKITAGPSVKPKPQMKAASLPRPPSRTGNDFVWPVEGRLVSTFGAKIGGQHNDGVNIAAPHGTPVRAAENGVVAYAG